MLGRQLDVTSIQSLDLQPVAVIALPLSILSEKVNFAFQRGEDETGPFDAVVINTLKTGPFALVHHDSDDEHCTIVLVSATSRPQEEFRSAVRPVIKYLSATQPAGKWQRIETPKQPFAGAKETPPRELTPT